MYIIYLKLSKKGFRKKSPQKKAPPDPNQSRGLSIGDPKFQTKIVRKQKNLRPW